MRRREFLEQTAAAGAVWALSPAARVLGANDRIRLGIIGPGARGQELLDQLLKLVAEENQNAQLVAVADVYTRRHDEVRKKFPDIKAVTDHRRLLDMKDIDAVLVACTPTARPRTSTGAFSSTAVPRAISMPSNSSTGGSFGNSREGTSPRTRCISSRG